MDEIEKVEDRKEEKGVKWLCNKTIEGKADDAEEFMSIKQAMDEVVHRENVRMNTIKHQLQQRSHFDYNYLNQWNNREYGIPQVHATLSQREEPHSSWS